MIPDYQSLMRPVLQAAADQEISVKEVIELLTAELSLSQEEAAQLLPSGRQTVFANRVHWAKTYLKQAGLVSSTRRGYFRATEAGRAALSTDAKLDRRYLLQFPAFKEFVERSRPATAEPPGDCADEASTPDEAIRQAFDQINTALTLDLIERVRSAPPEFFEALLVDLLIAMGYGGTSEEPGRALGRSGDDGVDGVIDQDPLGVDQIYIQAKRYQDGNAIGPAAIREFFGALSLKRAQKGIFVTTSTFTESATKTARDLGSRIVLIDGFTLARLMIKYGIGCRDEQVLHLKKLDGEYFPPQSGRVDVRQYRP
jgi:restriction system protein